MPVKPCQEDNKSGYKWGDRGKCYTYKEGNKEEERISKYLAEKQGKAIKASMNKKENLVEEDFQHRLNRCIEEMLNDE